MFPWGCVVACTIMANKRRREREREEQEEKERQRILLEKERRVRPFKPLEGKQVEIYPIYVYKMVKDYKIEDNGQINLLELVYKPKEIIARYELNDGKDTKIIQKNF